MNSILLEVLTATAGSVVLCKYVPQYTLGQSLVQTGIALLSTIWLIHLIYAVVIYPRFLSPLRHLPMPKGNSYFSGHNHILSKEPLGNPQRRWMNEVPNNGLIRYLIGFNQERILLTSPDVIQEALARKSYIFEKPERLRRRTEHVLGHGLVITEGEEHKKQRRNAQPIFRFRHLKNLYPAYWHTGQLLNQIIEADLAKERVSDVIEISHYFPRAALDMVGFTAIGIDFNSTTDCEQDIVKSYLSMFSPNEEIIKAWVWSYILPYWLMALLPLEASKKLVACAKHSRDTARDLVLKKQSSLEKTKDEAGFDFISLALTSGNFTVDEIANQVMTILGAGVDTTAVALTWTVYALCSYPSIQTRLREEIHSSLPANSESIDASQIDSLPYLHAVIQEILRFHPPIANTGRVSNQNTSLLDQVIPKGTQIVTTPWALNHNTHIWGPDAGEFNPERWLTGEKARTGGVDTAYGFATFLFGPRNCIGQENARAELKCIVAKFVGRFEFEMVDPDFRKKLVVKGPVTAKIQNEMFLRLRKVENWG